MADPFTVIFAVWLVGGICQLNFQSAHVALDVPAPVPLVIYALDSEILDTTGYWRPDSAIIAFHSVPVEPIGPVNTCWVIKPVPLPEETEPSRAI